MSRRPTMLKRAREYLAYRRTLGVELTSVEPLLLQFARYADRVSSRAPLTAQLAIRWAGLPQQASRVYLARRLDVVRCFAKHLAIVDSDTEIPPNNVFGPAYQRVTPYILNADEISSLLTAARGLSPCDGLRPQTYATLFGLLACTGLRLQEALRLSRSDIDWQQGLLTVRESKFRKSRLVPLHSTVISILSKYVELRDQHFPNAKSNSFFVSMRGTALNRGTVEGTFLDLRKKLPWPERGGRPAPRIHDLRHTFACQRLAQWCQQGEDVEQWLPVLSTYLGHSNVRDTYWYLTATPELLCMAGNRFELFSERQSEGRS